MSVDESPDVVADRHAGHRVQRRQPEVIATNGEAAPLAIDEPGVTGIVQIEADAEPGTVHESLAGVFSKCDAVPGLLQGGIQDAE